MKPLLFNACWYSFLCSLNSSSDEEMVASLLFTANSDVS